jgi:hypothetical protein
MPEWQSESKLQTIKKIYLCTFKWNYSVKNNSGVQPMNFKVLNWSLISQKIADENSHN